jgi:hypothetical protein
MNVEDIIDRQFNSSELELPDRYSTRANTHQRDSAFFSLSLEKDTQNMNKFKDLSSDIIDEEKEMFSNEGSFHEGEPLEVSLIKSPLVSLRDSIAQNKLKHNQRRQALSSKGNVNQIFILKQYWYLLLIFDSLT